MISFHIRNNFDSAVICVFSDFITVEAEWHVVVGIKIVSGVIPIAVSQSKAGI